MTTDDGEFVVKKWKHCIYCGWDGQTKKNYCPGTIEVDDEGGEMVCGQILHDGLRDSR